MNNTRYKYFVGLIIFIVLFFCTGNVKTADNYGLDTTANNAGLKEYNQPLPKIIGNIIGTGLSMIGVLFFVLMVYGGFLWMTAHGNEDQSKKALNTIIAATIGIIIVLSAYAITNFIFNSVKSSGGTMSTSCADVPPVGSHSCVPDTGSCRPGSSITDTTLCPTGKTCCTPQ